eukprot:g22821.t1
MCVANRSACLEDVARINLSISRCEKSASWRSALDLFAQLGGAREARQDAQLFQDAYHSSLADVISYNATIHALQWASRWQGQIR